MSARLSVVNSMNLFMPARYFRYLQENAEEQVEMHELCTAAAAGDVDALNRLLQRLPPQATAYAPGHRIDLATGSLPLHEAAREGHRACIEALAAAGADLNALDARGRTALQVMAAVCDSLF